MLTAGLGVAAFIFMIVALVLVLMMARARLVNTADVKIIVNGDDSNPIVAPAGTTLLNTLAAQKIFIPSACGGGGTCGVCKVHVKEGGGAILPTEKSHVSMGGDGRTRSRGWIRTSRCRLSPHHLRAPDF